jgi:pseudouridylate synthase
VESPQQVADVLRARRRLGTDSYGLVLANPIAPADEMDRPLHDRVLGAALAAAQAAGVYGLTA